MRKQPEIILGIVAPLGLDLSGYVKSLERTLKNQDFNVKEIKLTKLVLDKDYNFLDGHTNFLKIQSLKYFLKMQLLTKSRKDKGKGITAAYAIEEIIDFRAENANNKINCYIINQIKNSGEQQLLNSIYGDNYIQVSLYSDDHKRNDYLEAKFKNDELDKLDDYRFSTGKVNKEKMSEIIDEYIKTVLPDTSSKLLSKDYKDIDTNEYGQEVAKLYAESHYFINMDIDFEAQNERFIKLLTGCHKKFPTVEEKCMSVAYSISRTSNYVGTSQIGACIATEDGDIISVSAIKAPSSNSHHELSDKNRVSRGYNKIKEDIDSHIKKLIQLDKDDPDIKEIITLLSDTLDYHPCTHAEIAAICNSAKLGIKIDRTTLYTTMYPCHLCTKDIISSGIRSVVYIQPYLKSKNKALYSGIDTKDFKIQAFKGVGPKRFNYVFDQDVNINKKEDKNKDKYKDASNLSRKSIPLLKYRDVENYKFLEQAVCNEISGKITNKSSFVAMLKENDILK